MQLNQKFKVELPRSTVATILQLQDRGGNRKVKINDFILESVMERIAYKLQNPPLPTVNDENFPDGGTRTGRMRSDIPHMSNQPKDRVKWTMADVRRAFNVDFKRGMTVWCSTKPGEMVGRDEVGRVLLVETWDGQPRIRVKFKNATYCIPVRNLKEYKR